MLEPRSAQFSRIHRDPVLHADHGDVAGDALQMEGVVAGKIEAAVCRAYPRIARRFRQRKHRPAEVRVQSVGEGEVTDRPAEGLLQLLAGRKSPRDATTADRVIAPRLAWVKV